MSIAAFSVWAFGGKWLQNHWGEIGLYACCAIVFVGLSGVLLHPLLRGPGSLLRFYSIFIPAFIAYAVSWCVAWFLLGFGPGEWLGSLAGSAVFVAVVVWRLGSGRSFLLTTLVVFALHSAGYFLGGKAMQWLMGPSGSSIFSGTTKAGLAAIAKLAWGLLYGLGFGAGIGYAFSTRPSRGQNNLFSVTSQ